CLASFHRPPPDQKRSVQLQTSAPDCAPVTTTRATGETMNAQTAARQTTAPQTPPLPDAKPETIGLSSVRLQRMSDAFKREVDKGTLPGATVMVARRGQIGWVEARRPPKACA